MLESVSVPARNYLPGPGFILGRGSPPATIVGGKPDPARIPLGAGEIPLPEGERMQARKSILGVLAGAALLAGPSPAIFAQGPPPPGYYQGGNRSRYRPGRRRPAQTLGPRHAGGGGGSRAPPHRTGLPAGAVTQQFTPERPRNIITTRHPRVPSRSSMYERRGSKDSFLAECRAARGGVLGTTPLPAGGQPSNFPPDPRLKIDERSARYCGAANDSRGRG